MYRQKYGSALLSLQGHTVHSLSFPQTFSISWWTIGHLHDPVTWYGINYAGTQIAQCDFQNKGTRTGPGSPTFVCLESPTASFASQHNVFLTMWPDLAKGLLKLTGQELLMPLPFCRSSMWFCAKKISYLKTLYCFSKAQSLQAMTSPFILYKILRF